MIEDEILADSLHNLKYIFTIRKRPVDIMTQHR